MLEPAVLPMTVYAHATTRRDRSITSTSTWPSACTQLPRFSSGCHHHVCRPPADMSQIVRAHGKASPTIVWVCIITTGTNKDCVHAMTRPNLPRLQIQVDTPACTAPSTACCTSPTAQFVQRSSGCPTSITALVKRHDHTGWIVSTQAEPGHLYALTKVVGAMTWQQHHLESQP